MTKRNDAMDLLRATAILMVLLAHAIFSYGAPANIAPFQMFGIGVDLFFVLSGWLLGCALYKERLKNGKIDVKRFWVRRWYRTLPAYYAVLFLLSMQQYLTKSDFSFPLEYLLFVQNYAMPLNYFSVSWSLAVEEQFYLAIAPLLLLMGKTNVKLETLVLGILAFLPFVFRSLGWFDNPEQTHVRLDCCIFGVFLAHLYYHYKNAWQELIKASSALAVLSALIILSALVSRYFPEYKFQLDKLFLAFAFGFWVVCANSKEYTFNPYFKNAFYYVSTRSYSMYLLHPEALALANRVLPDIHFSLYFVFMFTVTCLLSECLYRFIELPFLRYRDTKKLVVYRQRAEI